MAKREAKVVVFEYVGRSGQTTTKKVVPQKWDFVTSLYHAGPRWTLYAFDVELALDRVYPMDRVKNWRPAR